MPFGGAGPPGGGSAARLSGLAGDSFGAGAGSGRAAAVRPASVLPVPALVARAQPCVPRVQLARREASAVWLFQAATQRKRTLSAKSSKKLQR